MWVCAFICVLIKCCTFNQTVLTPYDSQPTQIIIAQLFFFVLGATVQQPIRQKKHESKTC